MSDVLRANFLQCSRSGEEGINLALDEEVDWAERRIRDPVEVPGRIETD
jgi:hypothetical protein